MDGCVLRTLSVLTAVVAGLTGCAVGPNYHTPATKLPSDWHAPTPPSTASTSSQRETLIAWWQQFDDSTLSRLVMQAESDSPTLDKAWANIEKSRATLSNAKGSLFPSLTADGSVTRAKSVQIGVPPLSTTKSGSLDASWEIDLFGKLRRTKEAAQARFTARVSDWHDARVSLAAEVADTYVQYRACGLLAQAYEREFESMTSTERATSTMVDAGFTSPADGSLARADLANTNSSRIAQQAQCELLVKSLVALTGTEEAALRAILAEGKTELPEPTGLDVPAVPADALRQRPDLASLERELAATSAEIGEAKADRFPSLSLSGLITRTATTGIATATTWSFGPSLSLPIFDGGKRRAAVTTAEANYTAALADYRQGVRNAVKEVEQALVSLDAAAQRSKQAEAAAREYRSYVEAIEQNWREGGASLLDLETSRRSALSAEVTWLTVQRDRIEQWIALYKALGGGWQQGDAAISPSALATAKSDTQ